MFLFFYVAIIRFVGQIINYARKDKYFKYPKATTELDDNSLWLIMIIITIHATYSTQKKRKRKERKKILTVKNGLKK